MLLYRPEGVAAVRWTWLAGLAPSTPAPAYEPAHAAGSPGLHGRGECGSPHTPHTALCPSRRA